MKTYLITGVSGYVGQFLAKRLIDEGNRVIGVDINPPKGELAIEFISQDITLADPVGKIFEKEKPDVVVHLAFYSAPEKDEQLAYRVNVVGTKSILDAAAKHKVKKVLLASSAAAYGSHADNPLPLVETSPLRGNDEYYYSSHKRQQDELFQKFSVENPGIASVMLRPAVIVGKDINNQTGDLIKSKILVNPISGRDTPVQFIHQDDALEAFYLAIMGTATGIYNLGTSQTTTIAEFAKKVGKPCIHLPYWLLYGLANVSKAFGFTPIGGKSLAFAKYPIIMDTRKFEETFKFKPRFQSLEAIERFLGSI